MINKIETNDNEELQKTRIYIVCDKLVDFDRNEFIKKLIDLCFEYKAWNKKEY